MAEEVYKTYYNHEWACDWDCGMIVVKARSKKEAVELIWKKEKYDPDVDAEFYQSPPIKEEDLIELKDGEIVEVLGGT